VNTRNVITFVLSVFSVACISGCGNLTPSEAAAEANFAIFGGTESMPCEWPEVVSLGGCTGTLIHPRLVVYAAHCGTDFPEVRFGTEIGRSQFRKGVSFCKAYPDYELGDGTDLAFCVLENDVTEIVPARVLAGCELNELVEGVEVTAVGYGQANPKDFGGTKRWGRLHLATIGDEITAVDEEVDTCRGDSGGPIFLDIVDSDGHTEPRLVGVTSAGTDEICGSGIGHYVSLENRLEWLENASNLDVTPCFNEAGDWVPSPKCVSKTPMVESADDTKGSELSCALRGKPKKLSTCGPPYEEVTDHTAPRLLRLKPKHHVTRRELAKNESYVDFEIKVDITDDDSGVKQVTFNLLSENGEVLLTRDDEVPPYGLPFLRLPKGRYTLESKALDYEGNSAKDEAQFEIGPLENREPSGCQLKNQHQSTKATRGLWLLALGTLVMTLRRSQAIATRRASGA
jgi:V8-like Glu-specific endopeptidase